MKYHNYKLLTIQKQLILATVLLCVLHSFADAGGLRRKHPARRCAVANVSQRRHKAVGSSVARQRVLPCECFTEGECTGVYPERFPINLCLPAVQGVDVRNSPVGVPESLIDGQVSIERDRAVVGGETDENWLKRVASNLVLDAEVCTFSNAETTKIYSACDLLTTSGIPYELAIRSHSTTVFVNRLNFESAMAICSEIQKR